MAVRNLQFVLSGTDKSASRALDRVGSKASSLGSKLAGVGKAAAFGIAGVATAAVGGLAAAMANGIRDAMEYQSLAAKTAAVIKSTGNEANVTVKGVQKLAGELESLSGVDEALIINGQNVLLTFTKIRNEVGKDNDIFDRATEAALNMSVALGQDMQGSVTMLGKALNDPIKGIAAMGKAGIQFTQQQKDQIKTLVKSGKTLEAQKIILKELEVQFGGAAKAAGSGLEGSIARAKDAFGDLFRNIATPLLPKIAKWAEDFAVVVNDRVAPAIMRWIDQFERGVGPGGEFRANLESLGESARDAWPHIQDAYEKTKTIVDFVIKHKEAFFRIAEGVVAYKVAMIGVNFASMATGIGAVGTASGTAAPKVGQFGAAAARSAGPIAAMAVALTELSRAGKLDFSSFGRDGDVDRAIRAAREGDAGGFWDAIWGEGFKTNLPTWEKRQRDRQLNEAKSPVLRGGGSSQDRVTPLNPATKTYRDQRTAGNVMVQNNLDGKKVTTAVSSIRQGQISRGYRPAF